MAGGAGTGSTLAGSVGDDASTPAAMAPAAADAGSELVGPRKNGLASWPAGTEAAWLGLGFSVRVRVRVTVRVRVRVTVTVTVT